jgi:hypothetical protein
MRIWKLTPTDTADPIWKKWSPELIIVRAESERQARRLAETITNKTLPPLPPNIMPFNPWFGRPKIGDPSPTLCEDTTEQTDEYSVNGSAEVLRHGENF